MHCIPTILVVGFKPSPFFTNNLIKSFFTSVYQTKISVFIMTFSFRFVFYKECQINVLTRALILILTRASVHKFHILHFNEYTRSYMFFSLSDLMHYFMNTHIIYQNESEYYVTESIYLLVSKFQIIRR